MSEAKGGRARNRRTRRHAWLIASAAMVGSLSGQAAFAQVDMPSLAQAATVQFDIRAQSLDAALIEFSRQSGIQVSAETSTIGGKQTAGVSGRMSPEQALTTLLSGTGLVYRRAGTMLVVQGPSSTGTGIVLDPVQVQGVFPVPSQAMIDNLPPPYAGGQVATGGQLGLLGNRDVMDTPFNQTNYTAKKAQDQQARTVRDVLIDDPSVRSYFQDGGPGADAVRIRGFGVLPSDASYGGLYGLLPTSSIMAELAERIEVLKGPSALLNGMPPGGAIGGNINIVPKRAPEHGLTQLTAAYASMGQVGGQADVARRFGPEKQFGARFNGVFKAGQTAVEMNTDQRALAVLGLDFRGERVRLSADFGYQYQYIGGVVPYIGVAAGVPLPWAPAARSNAGAQPWSYNDRKDLFGAFRAEFDVTEQITAYVAMGAHDHRFIGLYASGITASSFYGTATTGITNTSQYQTFRTAEAGLRALLDTGPINHALAVTATTFANETGTSFATSPRFASNLYSPTFVSRPTAALPVTNKTSTQTLSSVGIADTMSAVEKRLQLTVGGRFQQVQSANFDPASGAKTAEYGQSAFSPAVALVFKPWDNVSVYGNWIQGLQEGTTVGSTFTNAGEVFPPTKSTQFEAGVKADWGKITTTASLFQISQPSILTNTANNTQYLGGEQVNQGLEFNVFGEVTEGVRLLGGVMFLNPILTKTQGGLTDGWVAPMSPTAQFNLAGEWDLPFVRGLTLNGRMVHTGSQYIDTQTPRRSLPEWTRFDVGARYAFQNPAADGKPLVALLSIENVLDSNYWAGGFGATTLMLGAPRTFRLSLTADF